MSEEDAPTPAPFDMAKINAGVEAMSEENRAAVMNMAEEVAAEIRAADKRTELCADDNSSGPKNWFDIEPADAVDLALPRPDIRGPVNEEGQPCPWPWKPQQLVGVPMGQHHCEYCGAMVVAGMQHVDYSGLTWERSEDHWINQDRFAEFRDAYYRARGHYSVAAEAYSKVDIVDAYRIWRTIQDGFEREALI